MSHLQKAIVQLQGQQKTKLDMSVVDRDEAWLLPKGEAPEPDWDTATFLNDLATIKKVLGMEAPAEGYLVLQDMDESMTHMIIELPPEEIDYGEFEWEGRTWAVLLPEMFSYFDSIEEFDAWHAETYGEEEEWGEGGGD